MNGPEAVRQIYRQYYADADAAEKRRSPADGLFGFGKKAADDPCHTAFYESLKAVLLEFRGQEPDSADVREVLSWIYEAPDTRPEPASVRWMLFAAHGLTAELIGCLNGTDAAALYADYGSRYRRFERFPVQQEVFRRLKKAAAAPPRPV